MKKCKIALTILSGILVLSGCQMQHTDEKKNQRSNKTKRFHLHLPGICYLNKVYMILGRMTNSVIILIVSSRICKATSLLEIKKFRLLEKI